MNIIIIFQNGGGVNDGVLNSYCWMYSSFMIPPDFEGPCAKQEHDGSVLYNSYYQARKRVRVYNKFYNVEGTHPQTKSAKYYEV